MSSFLVRVGLGPEWDVPACWGSGMSPGVGLGRRQEARIHGLTICLLFFSVCLVAVGEKEEVSV